MTREPVRWRLGLLGGQHHDDLRNGRMGHERAQRAQQHRYARDLEELLRGVAAKPGAPATGDDDHPDDFPDVDPPYEVLVRYEFPSEHLGAEEWRGREQDVFSWITVLARTPAGELVFLFDWECA